MAKERRLQNLTWEEVRELVTETEGTIILPIGSTEQHGRHLPVGSDTYVALTLAEDAGERTEVAVAPPLWFGWSPHHMVLPGTITVRPEVLVELVYDVVKSLKEHGFERFILLNGHRIVNITWLQIVGERAKRELGVKVVIFDPGYMSKEFGSELGWGELGHAEEIESSHIWYRYPELVKMDRVQDYPHQPRTLYSVDPSYRGDTLCYVPSSPEEQKLLAEKSGGVSGEPSKASQEGGRQYHEHLMGRLLQVVDLMKK